MVIARKGWDFECVDYETVAGSSISVDLVYAASPLGPQFVAADFDDKPYQEVKKMEVKHC
jgi:hypothetical protein